MKLVHLFLPFAQGQDFLKVLKTLRLKRPQSCLHWSREFTSNCVLSQWESGRKWIVSWFQLLVLIIRHGPHSLIGRSSTSVNWIFISSLPFWRKPEENLLSKIPSDDGCAAVRERLLFWVSSIFFCFVFIIRGFHWVDFSWQVFFCLYWWARIN